MGSRGKQDQVSIRDIIERGSARRAQRLTLEELKELSTCSWDIESSNLSGDFGIVLCASIKPLRGSITTYRLDDSAGYVRRPWDDRLLVTAVRDELERYSVVVHHYGDRFDIPFLNTRLIKHGERLLNTTNMVFVDTWWSARHRLRLHSNRLASLISHLDTKVTKTGLDGDLWNEAVAGRRESMDKVVEHNIRDVKALEQVVVRMAGVMGLRYCYLK